MTAVTETHYVARVVVEKVENVPAGGLNPQKKREVQEMGSFTIKDSDLRKLLDKVSAHISLVGD
jgi:hypothetical protein